MTKKTALSLIDAKRDQTVDSAAVSTTTTCVHWLWQGFIWCIQWLATGQRQGLSVLAKVAPTNQIFPLERDSTEAQSGPAFMFIFVPTVSTR